jgi:hypothetical protein
MQRVRIAHFAVLLELHLTLLCRLARCSVVATAALFTNEADIDSFAHGTESVAHLRGFAPVSPRKRLGPRLQPFDLGDDLLLYIAGHRRVLSKMQRRGRAALGHGPQVSDVAKHLREGYFRVEHLRVATLAHAQNFAAA